MFQKVLLAVDGSPHSAKAVPVAADIAKKSGSEVVVFHAREYLLAKGGAYALEDEAEATELVDGIKSQAAAGPAGPRLRATRPTGGPPEPAPRVASNGASGGG